MGIENSLAVDDAMKKLNSCKLMILPDRPPGIRSKSQVAMLKAGEEYMLDGSIRKVKMGLGWNAGCDVDGSCVMMDANKRTVETVSYSQLSSNDNTVKHSGDDRTGEGGGDDEVIKVALEKLPEHIHYLLFIVTVFSKNYTFADVKSCYVRMVHRKKFGKNPELSRLDLSGGPGEAMALACLVRKGSYWSMVALGVPLVGRTVAMVMAMNELQFMAPLQSFHPPMKVVHISVLAGRDLVGKDSHMFGKATSDCYYVLEFSGRGGKKSKITHRSETVKKTVNPSWAASAASRIPLGHVHASTMKLVKIRVFDEDNLSADDFLGEVRIPAACLWNNPDGAGEGWLPLYPMFAAPPKVCKFPTKNVKGELRIKWEVQTVHFEPQRIK